MIGLADITSLLITVAVVGFSWYLLRNYLMAGRQQCSSETTLRGKTAIVTGANTGIGKETARDLARRGARVILACRNITRGMAAASDIESGAKGQLIVRKLDLASIKSIRNFVEQIKASEESVDILVNNAGLFCAKATTEDGFDMQFGVNHLGHFLLTLLLLDMIKSSAPSRIVNVSSTIHSQGKINWEDLNLELPNSYGPIKAYAQSKLANILFTRELAKRLQGTKVTVYAVHPGGVRTDIDRNFNEVLPSVLLVAYRAFTTCLPFMLKTSQQGAQTTIYCAVAEEVAAQSGLYYSNCKVTQPASQAMDDEAAVRLWDVSLKMVGISEPT